MVIKHYQGLQVHVVAWGKEVKLQIDLIYTFKVPLMVCGFHSLLCSLKGEFREFCAELVFVAVNIDVKIILILQDLYLTYREMKILGLIQYSMLNWYTK